MILRELLLRRFLVKAGIVEEKALDEQGIFFINAIFTATAEYAEGLTAYKDFMDAVNPLCPVEEYDNKNCGKPAKSG